MLLVITTLLQLSFLMRVGFYIVTTVTYVVVHHVILENYLDDFDETNMIRYVGNYAVHIRMDFPLNE